MERRRGFTLLEVGTAGIMLAILMVICLQMLRATSAQRRALRDQRIAVREVDNVMERLCAQPWQELTPESVGSLEVHKEVQKSLPGSKLEVDVVEPDDEPNAKRITVVLRWAGRPQRPDPSVRLVAWKYRDGKE